MNKDVPKILVVLGPTASGKTNLACALALKLDGEIISADSRQVYRYMDIGTGKDLDEYIVNGVKIPYHLIDIKDPGYKYNIAEYQMDFLEALKDIHTRGKTIILCGGSGLYIEAALKGHSFLGIPMNEERRAELEQYSDDDLNREYMGISEEVRKVLNNQTQRRAIRAIIIQEYLNENPDFKTIEIPAFNYTIIGVDIERDKRREKISNRLIYRLNNGLIEEGQWLLENHLTHEDLDYYGLEYKWIGMFLRKEISNDAFIEGLRIAIHQFSKRQMTWFRRMEKNGFDINWVNAAEPLQEKVNQVLSIYQS